jgi:hypothetical protein
MTNRIFERRVFPVVVWSDRNIDEDVLSAAGDKVLAAKSKKFKGYWKATLDLDASDAVGLDDAFKKIDSINGVLMVS